MAARKSRSMLILLLGLLFTSWFSLFGHGRKVVGDDIASIEKGLKDVGAGEGTNSVSEETMRPDNYKGSIALGKSTLWISNANGQLTRVNGRQMVVEDNKQIGADLPEEVDEVVFASAADYTPPKRHPPKNN